MSDGHPDSAPAVPPAEAPVPAAATAVETEAVEGRRSFSNAAEYVQSQRASVSQPPAADAVVPPPAPVEPAAAPIDDDDDDALLGVQAQPTTEQPAATAEAADADALADAMDAAEPEEPVKPPTPPPLYPPDLKMADLFGDFQPMRHQTHAEDPELYDVLQVCHDLFGDGITEMELYRDLHIDVDIDDHRLHVVTEHKRLDDVQPIIDVFGDTAIDWFTHDMIAGGEFEHARVVECKRPVNPFSKAARPGRDEVWLMDMAKVHPNRQVLHLAPKPFDKNSALKPQNTPRDFFTPQSCIQWAKSKSGRVVSNARVVRWSDGSATLHVGADVYELPTNNERVLAMVARRSELIDGQAIDTETYVEAVPVARHVTAIPARGRPSSVNEALVREIQDAQKAHDPTTSLQYSAPGVPVIRSDTERNKAPSDHRKLTDEERFLEIARQERERDQKKHGKMTAMELIADELRAYEELCEATKGQTVAELVRQKDAELKAEHDRQKHARMARAIVDADGNVIGQRSKFDRDTGLQTAGGDNGDGPSNGEFARSASAAPSSVAERSMNDRAAANAARAAAAAASYAAEDEDDLLLPGSGAREGSKKRSRSRAGDETLAELEQQRSTINMPARPEDSQSA
uniref:Leo1-like protein n=1 Tax=Neobodo designis TaxID=312471 RepID=A0A7S1Q8K8_NEODS|mmetsp:Transcript_34831/g.107525  ORF Transcript_34831/g.107525 Transcript_34831/m.107525 type:complete len:630 (+) Transcript_34831:35-1924(+)|eukprot:CAMPEP_0174832418 /NCGR_PEP_ID=MMETSP1114-20130205/3669_1 /TAXON_ID=312471 /ORGANISM="Neobodo designis, Strain CCAP 1951/1" /LENGTH=629 /DNA_ID=CAMNT_0016066277 /DNA_START=34 /DNA_END=1923 /DNA_ORIENTATION=-